MIVAFVVTPPDVVAMLYAVPPILMAISISDLVGTFMPAPSANKDLDFENSNKNRQWNAFARRLPSDKSPEQTVTTIANFALPCLSAITSGVEFNAIWRGRTWIDETRDN